MTYIGQDGTVGGRKPFSRAIIEFIEGITNFISLFFGSITNPPRRIESRSTYGRRNGNNSRRGGSGRPLGGNVRGIKDLGGDAQARMGG
ncbi:unnamed protein product [Cylindrotheca closterium]|uniref:Selenoprotein K n=1 Tax=Cylindrotheca closterium TaxID=2856 RepID=A0AAD2GBP5_9STRA|nr:unnamed protein product [Cylindrotheca closterium]